MTRTKLQQLPATAKPSSTDRHRRLELVFGGLLILGIAPVGVFCPLSELPQAVMLACIGLFLAGVLALGSYILVTSRAFQRK
jgi:hypothetical protein